MRLGQKIYTILVFTSLTIGDRLGASIVSGVKNYFTNFTPPDTPLTFRGSVRNAPREEASSFFSKQEEAHPKIEKQVLPKMLAFLCFQMFHAASIVISLKAGLCEVAIEASSIFCLSSFVPQSTPIISKHLLAN